MAKPWVGGALALLLAAGCATDPMLRLRGASLPLPPPAAEVLVRQGKRADAWIGGYANYKAVVNTLGMQVGERHFDKARFPDYLAQAGFPKLADEAGMALQRQALQDSLIEDNDQGVGGGAGGNFGSAGGDLAGLAAEVVLYVAMEAAIDHHNQALEKQISDLARRSRPFNGVADDYNSQVALRFGLNPSVVETFPYRPMPSAVGGPAQIGPNAALEDWVQDYDLSETPAHWFLGDDRAKVAQVEAALAPAGEEGDFHWSRRMPWIAGAVGVAATACLLNGLITYQTPPQSNTSLGIGAGLLCAGLGLEWRAMDLRSLTFQRYDDYLRARLSHAQ
ncbi:MAG TPA: hypothetical protein VK842_06065 [bacterium]|nr:hypothetical protein [bacterium]